jgi:hypothetical protein
MIYCDTSILAAYYCPEKLSTAAQKTIRSSEKPVISSLVEVEFCSAVALKVRTKELDPASGNRILSMFQIHIDDGCFDILPIQDREYHLAKEWISRFSVPLRTLDGLHLAAAFSEDLTLVTADKALHNAAHKLGVKSTLLT